jgi:hypothetical protein
MVTREISLEPVRTAARLDVDRLKGLNLRIALLAALVVIELWGLTAALDAWASGDLQSLPLLLGAQLVAFVIALGTWITAPREAAAGPGIATIVTPQTTALAIAAPQAAAATE